jgi:hypothetical protein
MSTRSTTHFTYEANSKPTAIIYRHSDGYPEGAGVDLRRFIKQCSELNDSRLSDPSYLAAKYVVFLADMFNWSYDFKNGGMEKKRPASRLEFISVGVVNEDPGDIEYRYVINCGKIVNGLPELKCYSVGWDKPKKLKEVPIPGIGIEKNEETVA